MSKIALDAYTIQRAVINASANGNNTLIAGTIGKQIWVLSFFMIAGGTVNVTFQDGAGGTNISGAIPLIANTGVSCPHNEAAWCQTTTLGNLLNLNLSAAIQVSGMFNYILV